MDTTSVRTLAAIGKRHQALALPTNCGRRILFVDDMLTLLFLTEPFGDERLDEQAAMADRQIRVARGLGIALDVCGLYRRIELNTKRNLEDCQEPITSLRQHLLIGNVELVK